MKNLFKIGVITVALLASLGLVTRNASASPILGQQLYYTGGDITVETLYSSAGYTSDLDLYLLSPTTNVSSILVELGTNHDYIGRMTTFNPGTLFGYSVSQELIFGIYVRNTGNTFLMGPSSRNSDGQIHAAVDDLGSNNYIVGFEDLYGGGDRDYDDNVFKFTGSLTNNVPEPMSLLLMGAGLVGLGFMRRARR